VNRLPTTSARDGLHAAANPFTRYSGVWTFSPLGADIGWLRDSRFAFDFVGREVALLLRKSDYVGYLYPTLKTQFDASAVAANALPYDAAGNPYVILTSGSLTPETLLVPIAHDLPFGAYTLEAVADRGYDQYALVGYAVSSGDLATPYNQQIAVAWVTTFASFVAVLVMARGINWRLALQPLHRIGLRLSLLQQFLISFLTSLALMIGFLLTWGEAVPTLFRRDSVQLGLSILTAGLLYLNPALPLTLASAFILFVILYQRPQFGLALILFYAPFFLFPVELYRFAFPMAELLTLMTFSAFVLHLLTQWGRYRQSAVSQYPLQLQIKWHPLDYTMMAYVGLGVVSLSWAAQAAPAFTELRTLLIEPALVYVMLRTLCLTREDVLRLVDALLAAGFVVCIIGLILYARGEGIITAEGLAGRLASVYGSPNNVALFLGRCLPFALAFALIALDSLRRQIAAFVCAVMLITAIFTQSVGGLFIGIPAGIAAVILMVYRRKALLPLIVIAVLIILGFAIGTSLSERFARALDFTSGTNFYRIRVWQSALTILSDQPITGLGLDQFLYAFRGQYIYPDAWQEPNLSHPHNLLLDFWVRLGIGGVILLFALFGVIIASARQAFSHLYPQDRLLSALLIGTIGSFVNLVAHGLVDNSVFVLDLAYVFVLLQALIVFLSQYPSQLSQLSSTS
jgi:O-antigen ligase